VDLWNGVQDATNFGGISLQMNLLTREIIGIEDCFYLNVYTTDVEPGKKCAVMMWMQSGDYTSCSGNNLLCGPDHIVQKDVLLITLNYRLNIFSR
ncbi:Esterase B1, partial [Harpegnathos saltator]